MDRDHDRRNRHGSTTRRDYHKSHKIKEPVDHNEHRRSVNRKHDDQVRDDSRSYSNFNREERARSRSPRRKSERDRRRQKEEEEAAKFQYGANIKKEPGTEEEGETVIEKQKPNFGLSGKLTEEKNTCNGVVVKYSEPPEAHIPKRRWRFYVFKGDQHMPTLYLHRQSAYLMGRDRKVADIPVDHPSCSKQHAVLQFRLVNYERPDGTTGRTIRPYIIDLEAANGTYVNNTKIEPKRYVELREKDVLKFGFSSREYVLLHDESKDAAMDDIGQ